MKKLLSAAALAGLLLTAGCGGSEETQDGLSAKERSDLDNAAMMLEGNQVIDTSADSLVLEESASDPAMTGNEAAPAANAANLGNQTTSR